MNLLPYLLGCVELLATLIHHSTAIKCYECGVSMNFERECTEKVTYDTSLCVQEEDGDVKDVCGIWVDEKGTVTMRNCLSSSDIVKRIKVNGKPVKAGKCFPNVTMTNSQASIFDEDAGNDRVYGRFCSCFGDGCNRNSAFLNRITSFWACLIPILVSVFFPRWN